MDDDAWRFDIPTNGKRTRYFDFFSPRKVSESFKKKSSTISRNPKQVYCFLFENGARNIIQDKKVLTSINVFKNKNIDIWIKKMGVSVDELIEDLVERTKVNINQAEKFKTHSIEQLNSRNQEKSWSILECLEHLNLYGDFYIPEIKKQIKSGKKPPNKNFKSGILGDYFAKSMLPKEKLKKIKTFKDKNPIGSLLDKTAIDRFISQQHKLLELLNESLKIDLNKTKTAISISKLIKLKLGDTLRVVIYHNDRHMTQANRVLNMY